STFLLKQLPAQEKL
ncbi:hypothetical protein D046_4649B, partial [Vibrio parahaemolyticus V-223/04]